MVDFIYDFIQLLSGIIPRNGFCHHWALFVIEICFEEAITRRRCFGRGGKIYSNGCRFADDLIRRVHNEDASLSLSYSVSSSLSSKCMPMWTSVVAMFRSFKNTQEKEYPSNTLTKTSRLLWLPITSRGQLGGQLSVFFTVMTIIVFCTCCYNCSQCTNHGCKLLRTTFQMCLIHWTHRHSIAVVVFDSNDLNWLSLERFLCDLLAG